MSIVHGKLYKSGDSIIRGKVRVRVRVGGRGWD